METTDKTKAVVKTDNSIPANLIALALKQKAPVEQLEKLLAMQERWEKTKAEKEFNLAMASFQKECPVIEKKKIVKNKTGQERYRFAPIGDIIRQVKNLLAKHKFFYNFTKEDSEGFLTAICTATHESGHSKQSSFKVPIGKEDYMSDVQKYGARRTFANRYAFCDVFGITTADADVDGQESGKETPIKLTKEASSDLLTKAKIIIDEYEKADDLQKNGRLFLQEQKGLNEKDKKELAAHITIKYKELTKTKNENT